MFSKSRLLQKHQKASIWGKGLMLSNPTTLSIKEQNPLLPFSESSAWLGPRSNMWPPATKGNTVPLNHRDEQQRARKYCRKVHADMRTHKLQCPVFVWLGKFVNFVYRLNTGLVCRLRCELEIVFHFWRRKNWIGKREIFIKISCKIRVMSNCASQ